MVGRRRPRQPSVGRLLVRLSLVGAALLVAWATWATRASLRNSLLARLETQLTTSAQALVNLAVDAAHRRDADMLQVEAAVSGLDHVAVISTENDRLRCIAANEPAWVDRELWRLAMDLPQGWEELVAEASGEPLLSADGQLFQIAMRVTEDRIFYASLSTASAQPQLRALTLGLLLRSTLMVLVVGALGVGLLWVWAVRPLQRLAQAGESLATRRSGQRIALEGPSEIAKLAAALNALADDAEAERGRAEDQARRWRGLFDEIPAVGFVFSEGGRVLEANRRAAEVLGSDVEALRQRSRTDVVPDGESLRIAPRETTPVKWVESPVEHEGRPATLAIALDMSEARAGELRTRHLARVLDSVDVAVIELSPDGHVEACNAEASRLVCKPVEEIRGLALAELFVGEPPLPSWAEITAAVHRDGAWRDETTLNDRAGSTRELAIRITSLPAPLSTPSGLLVIARDVTDHRRLRRALDRAERLEELGALAAGIMPEFQHQLNGLLTYTEHLRRLSQENAELQAGLASIEASSHRAQGLIERLIRFARESVLCLAPGDLNRLVQEIAAGPEILANPCISVTVDVDADMPPVEIDAPLLREALRAVVLCAVEAMPGGGTVQVTTHGRTGEEGSRAGQASGPCAVVEIRDTGNVIDPDLMQRARDPFFSTHGGGGLVLIRAAGMIQLMGGELTVQGGSGDGTVVAIAFPVEGVAVEEQTGLGGAEGHQDGDPSEPTPSPIELMTREDTDQAIQELISEDDERGPEGEQQAMALEERDEGEKTPTADDDEAAAPQAEIQALLLVDDEEVVLDLVCDILDDEPFEVLTAADGEEALATLATHGDRIFLALVDLVLPGMDGWRLAEAIAQERPGLPIHIASGYEVSEDDVPPWARSAVTGLIHKPFRAGRLRELTERELMRSA